MPTSDNGWNVVGPEGLLSTEHLTTVYPKGSGVPFRVRRVAAPLFQALVDFLDSIEPVELEGWDGGYAYRKTRGSDTAWSTHSSGTGIDWNASRHPRGQRNTWTIRQRIAIRRFLRSHAGQAFKWGADFTTVPDDMHFQLRDPATVRRILAELAVKPPAAPPRNPKPEETPMLVTYFRSDVPESQQRLYDISSGKLRYVSGDEVRQLRKQGGKLISIGKPGNDPIWKLSEL